jgi:uncharacterized Ntn-hydrolase superfamily protein
MTYSLVARDEDGTTFGVVTASKYLAVGATVPAVAGGRGALVTQGHTNTEFRDEGLELLEAGSDAASVVDTLVQGDPGRSWRQLAVVGPGGDAAAWTGEDCSDVAGHLVGGSCVAAGNLLAGDGVLPAMVGTFEASSGPLAERLLLALAAGEEAGGDRRGRQAAALLVLGVEDRGQLRSPARVDLRVDDHPDPIGELRRLLELHRLVVEGPDPETALPLEGDVAAEVDLLLMAAGHTDGILEQRLTAWAYRENLEHRLLVGRVDAVLLDEMRSRSGALRRRVV